MTNIPLYGPTPDPKLTMHLKCPNMNHGNKKRPKERTNIKTHKNTMLKREDMPYMSGTHHIPCVECKILVLFLIKPSYLHINLKYK